MRRAVAFAALIASLAIGASSARAARVADLGAGNSATVAVDPAGNGYVLWAADDPADATHTVLAFCRLPACAPVLLPRPPFGEAHDPHLLRRRADGALFAVAAGENGAAQYVTYLWTSLDGGATWSGPAPVGGGLRNIDAAALTSDGRAIDLVQGIVSHDGFQRVPLGGAPESRLVSLLPEPSGAPTVFYYSLNVAELRTGGPMLIADDHHRRTRYRLFAGGDLYANASWTPWAAAKALHSGDPSLGDGALGPAIVTQGGVASPRIYAQRWLGTRFSRRRTIGRLTLNGGAGPVLAQAPAGGLHAAWLVAARQCHRFDCIAYRASRRGLRFGHERRFRIGRGAAPIPRRMAIAADVAGHGWLVWSDGQGTGAHVGRVRALGF